PRTPGPPAAGLLGLGLLPVSRPAGWAGALPACAARDAAAPGRARRRRKRRRRIAAREHQAC
ncbi:hypothetical protein, partial [Burkholderia pseudomallei]|uniref:hypothetical protein n=1 Tax=Burkholderia pseudomallei TaxID=28450 RepID=UPI0029340188